MTVFVVHYPNWKKNLKNVHKDTQVSAFFVAGSWSEIISILVL